MKKIVACLCLVIAYLHLVSQTVVTETFCENLQNPIGINVADPRFTWKISSTQSSTMQIAYEVVVSKAKRKVWSTGKVRSDQSVFVSYGGQTLEPDTKYHWQVRIWDNHGNISPGQVHQHFTLPF